MKQYQWLLFDADGTLFDFELAEARALEGTFQNQGLTFIPQAAEYYHQINQQIWVDFEQGRITSQALRVERFARLFQAFSIPVDVETFSAHYLINLSNQPHLLPGVESTLQALAPHYRFALITNGLKDVQRPRLVHSTIHSYFEVVAISEELGAAKPDPAYFDAVFQQMGQPSKSQALVIGDSLSSDIQGGIRYGLDTCWYNPSGKTTTLPVTCEIRQIPDLIPLLL